MIVDTIAIPKPAPNVSITQNNARVGDLPFVMLVRKIVLERGKVCLHRFSTLEIWHRGGNFGKIWPQIQKQIGKAKTLQITY